MSETSGRGGGSALAVDPRRPQRVVQCAGREPMSGPALQRERLPCFVVRPGLTILPAFGSFTGMASVLPEPADQVFVVADGEVLPILRNADV